MINDNKNKSNDYVKTTVNMCSIVVNMCSIVVNMYAGLL